MMGCGRTTVFTLLRRGIIERAPRYGRELRILRSSVEAALIGPQTQAPKKRAQSAGVIPIASRTNIKW